MEDAKRVQANIEAVMEFVRNDWDWVIVIDGRERGGKSDLMLRILYYSNPHIRIAIETADYDFLLRKLSWNFEQYQERIKSGRPGGQVGYDEASVLGRESMSEFNRRMIRIMTTVGFKNLLYVWTFPKFGMLDPYIRNHRARTRIFVKTVRGMRGVSNWWISNNMEWPKTEGGTTVYWRKAFSVLLPSFKTMSKNHAEFWAKYQERDEEAKNLVLENSEIDPRLEIAVRLKGRNLTEEQIGWIVGRSKSWVKQNVSTVYNRASEETKKGKNTGYNTGVDVETVIKDLKAGKNLVKENAAASAIKKMTTDGYISADSPSEESA